MSDAKIARFTLAFIFVYHGLMPKLLFLSATELALNTAHGVPLPVAHQVAVLGGVAEVVLGLLMACLPRQIWPVKIAMLLLLVLLCDVAFFMPHLLVEAFNPVSINVAGLALGAIVCRAHGLRRLARP